MRSIPTALSVELLKDANFLCHLIELNFSTPLYFTDLDVDVYHNGHQYMARGMELANVSTSMSMEVDNTSFVIDNVSRDISTTILNEEVRGKRCTIRLAALTDHASVIGEMVKFAGIIDSFPNMDEKKVPLEIYSPFVFWKRKTPRRIHQATCPWIFKDSETCRYAGTSACDLSWDNCATLNNTINFGGFRWILSLQNKQIWWGRAPK
ncbi:MAG: DUF2163 domain-containing protein [Nitrospirae bacterium]|nr:MAG: DUF2163 domain-containing protein [Nitrospirota bacterium]